jgi:hypothetical protein
MALSASAIPGKAARKHWFSGSLCWRELESKDPSRFQAV